MKYVPVDVDEVAMAMSLNTYEYTHYLNTDTGEVVMIEAGLMDFDYDDELAIRRLPEWQRELMPVLRQIDETDIFEAIPSIPVQEKIEVMFNFAQLVETEELQGKLFQALQQEHLGMRKFKSILAYYPEIEQQWFLCEEEYLRRQVLEWLASLGLGPLHKPVCVK